MRRGLGEFPGDEARRYTLPDDIPPRRPRALAHTHFRRERLPRCCATETKRNRGRQSGMAEASIRPCWTVEENPWSWGRKSSFDEDVPIFLRRYYGMAEWRKGPCLAIMFG